MQKTSKQPLVSVIIPTRNSEATIEKCLRSIKKQSYDNIKIIVVDNYSADKTRQIAKKYGAKIYLKGPERSAQVNFGAEKSSGKYIYRVDSDFVLQSDVIRDGVESCERCGYDAIVIHNASDPTVSFWARVRKAERDCYKDDELNVAARFWKKEVFLALGGFDECLVAGDDYDLHNRLVKNGFKIGRIKAGETHIGEPKTLAEIVRTNYYYGKNIRSFIKKNPQKALRQLSPLRESYVKGLSNFFSDPILIVGFVIYQFVRYTAATIGIISGEKQGLVQRTPK
ncbi:MAG: glycosyltransferase [Candidatus Bathyarchaeota archaeon]|nr:glycosyltransferase [Candidatus Bathyarchaeota archaeon]